MRIVLFLTAAVLSLAGCSSTNGGGDLPACTWPASLDSSGTSAGASGGQCVAARTYLTCTAPSGAGTACISDDPTQCPNSGGFTCQNQCHADEYGAQCGMVGPGTSPAPPAGCRLVGPTPGGIEFYCCPCGS